LNLFPNLLTPDPPLALAIASRMRSDWLPVVCAVALVALAIAVVYLWNTLRKTRAGGGRGSSDDLFTELCDAHELNRLERTLIVQLAASYEMPQPAALFVDPWTLEQAAAAPGSEAHRYGSLRQKLFGSLE
jgi:hypothetical protein